MNRPNSSSNNNKLVKKPKEIERPPWRSTATVPKVDKNALLKAKLLDASRRAIKASKQSNISTQTDPIPVKLMKEASIEIQNDLILMCDQECLTDGTITVKDSSGNCKKIH